MLNYSRPPPPPNTADLETDEKAAVFGNRVLGVIYYLKTLIWDLEMGGGIWGGGAGGGIGRGGIGGGGGRLLCRITHDKVNGNQSLSGKK